MSATSGTKTVQLSASPQGESIEIEGFHARVVDHCADTIARFAQQRAAFSLATAPETEIRIGHQRDAILSLQGNGGSHISAWWQRSVDSGDPWKVWAVIFVLGELGDVASRGRIRGALELLPDDDEDRWAVAAEALGLVSLPDPVALGHDLWSSPSAVSQAVGLDLLARLGALTIDLLRDGINHPEPAVMASAARATVRTGAVRELAPELTDCLDVPSRAVAWEAARALTIAGLSAAYFYLREDRKLASTLGPLGIEILTMAGDDLDIGRCETLIAETPVTAPVLSAVGRFGNVTAWSFLLHYLADPALVEATVYALRTLFGDLVPGADVTSFPAWKEAIAEADFNPVLRYRRGKPWSPSTVLAECASGTLSRGEVERRLDELASRLGAGPSVDLALWGPDAKRQLAVFDTDALARGAGWRPGAWRA